MPVCAQVTEMVAIVKPDERSASHRAEPLAEASVQVNFHVENLLLAAEERDELEVGVINNETKNAGAEDTCFFGGAGSDFYSSRA